MFMSLGMVQAGHAGTCVTDLRSPRGSGTAVEWKSQKQVLSVDLGSNVCRLPSDQGFCEQVP